MTDHQHTADVLNRAADLIEERGWEQGNSGLRVAGPHCILGAIGAAADLDDFLSGDTIYNPTACLDSAAGLAVRSYLDHGPERIEETRAVWSWNDEGERTATEVIEVLRAAAAIEQAKHDASTDAGELVDSTPDAELLIYEDGSWVVKARVGTRYIVDALPDPFAYDAVAECLAIADEGAARAVAR